MPTKEELEQENAALRQQVADMVPALVVSPHPDCELTCMHGFRYHLDLCNEEMAGEYYIPCICPEHPEPEPERKLVSP